MSTRATIHCNDDFHLFTELVPDFVGAETQVELPERCLIERETYRFTKDGTMDTVVVALPMELLLAIARRFSDAALDARR